jgi:antitoxin (DNA-binding transcriptional repressor) of toxin-antitoxin stability system
MKTVGVFDAKRRLSELIDSLEVVTITRQGRPVATLSAVRQNPVDVARRIRENPCIQATTDEVVALIHEGRR